ncbi:hypothetical protein KFL_000220150 [Klebsormidium nitens]|uniref:Sialidase domain-containing protein n=1 Tax=Klebsormidium nitens TaxID=105231 RepID=A0A1Y1HK87_KLENI|nr:hypothetical protein KFL_000220150 [Klebsormidium nitens]|eukprot:GAQ78984.1 hypothetical protein KFL_000220150 [Klebsormidium nitens]
MVLGLEGSVASPRHRFGPQSSPKAGKRPGAKGFRASVVRGVRDCFNPHSTSCLTSLPLFLAALVLSFTLVRFYDAVDQRIDAVHRLTLKEEELADVLATRAEARVAVLQARKRLVTLEEDAELQRQELERALATANRLEREMTRMQQVGKAALLQANKNPTNLVGGASEDAAHELLMCSAHVRVAQGEINQLEGRLGVARDLLLEAVGGQAWSANTKWVEAEKTGEKLDPRGFLPEGARKEVGAGLREVGGQALEVISEAEEELQIDQLARMPRAGIVSPGDGCNHVAPPSTKFAVQWAPPRRWVFQPKDGILHNLRPTISRLPHISPWRWIAVWQASKGKEGFGDQHLRCAFSEDAREWTNSLYLPLKSSSGCVWSPVLHLDPQTDVLWLFYTESVSCKQLQKCDDCESPWSPGGDISYVRSEDGLTWSEPETVLPQKEFGNIPRMIAGQLTITTAGEWVLPFWGQRPLEASSEDACGSDSVMPEHGGVLVSDTNGTSWHPYGYIVGKDGEYMREGSVARLEGKTLVQYFGTSMGELVESRSEDGGHTWGSVQPTGLSNPGSKANLLALSSGALAVALNNASNPGNRTNLHVALMRQYGKKWEQFAVVESGDELGEHVHYQHPTLFQDGCRLLVVYSVQPLKLKKTPLGGIRIAEVDLSLASLASDTRTQERMLLADGRTVHVTST